MAIKTIKKPIIWLLALTFILSMMPGTWAAGVPELDAAVSGVAEYVYQEVPDPQVGSIGGEWAVIGLARSGCPVPDFYYENYYKTVKEYVKECDGILHQKKYTEYSRVILGLTAAGYDPRNVEGYDLTVPLGDFDKTVWQGINGPIWALIALDSADYSVPQNPSASTQATRDLYIAEILRRQLPNGGFNLTAGANGAPIDGAEQADPDLTGMALQALAKYQSKPEVKTATDRALACLSQLQYSDGGYASWGTSNCESAVQVLAALCELGIGTDDPRFVKNGKTVVDNILSFQNENGSFKHTAEGSGNNQMATEQAFYGLVAAQRAIKGKNSLYRMDDAVKRGSIVINRTITFDSTGGSPVEPITEPPGGTINAPAAPTRSGYTFLGWYASVDDAAAYSFGIMPQQNITLYAKWSRNSTGGSGGTSDPLASDKNIAQNALTDTYDLYQKNDYSTGEWAQLNDAYNAGKSAINSASAYDGIQKALADAAEAMAAVPASKAGNIKIAVTMEKFTVDGKFIIEPTLVTVPKYTLASVVITDLMKKRYPGNTQPWRITGTVKKAFYLASAYDPGYNGNDITYPGFLSEFDEGPESGWMYAVNNSFPGVGASAWTLDNHDVMRWQYTRTGLGADIGADNSAWSTRPSVHTADKDQLIWKLAEINDKSDKAAWMKSGSNQSIYDAAVNVMSNITASQAQVDKALEDLDNSSDSADNGNQSGGNTPSRGSGPSTNDSAIATANPVITGDENSGSEWINPYSDVAGTDWFHDAVKYVTEKGIMKGTGGSLFSSDSNVTRAMLVAMLYRYEGEPADSADNPFSDVAEGQWYTNAVVWAVKNGIISGYGDGVFGADDPVTREQLVTVLYNYAVKKGLDVSQGADLSGYTDMVEIPEWALGALRWARGSGILNGRTEKELAPQGTATRAEVATLFMRYMVTLNK